MTWNEFRGYSRLASIVLISLIIASGLLIGSVGVSAQSSDAPAVPASYYGELTINGDPAPEGATIEATIDGEIRGSISVEETGEYGGPTGSDRKLTVEGTVDDEGKDIVFYVTAAGLERAAADETAIWTSGSITELDLTAKLGSASSGGGGGGGGGGSGAAPQPPATPDETTTETKVPVPESDGSGERRLSIPNTSTSEIVFFEGANDTESPELPTEVTISESEATIDVSPTTYSAVEIDTGDVDTSQVRGTVTMEVPIGKVENGDLQMYRRSTPDSDWEALETSVEENGSIYVVTGETPGFSTFAVGDAVNQKEEPSMTESPTDDSTDGSVGTGAGPSSGDTSTDRSTSGLTESPEEQSGFTIIVTGLSIILLYSIRTRTH